MSILDLLFPTTVCLFCKQKKDLVDGVCQSCAEEFIKFADPVCQRCGAPLQAGQLCDQCQKPSPPFEACRSVFEYNGKMVELIHRFKYRGEFYHFAKILSKNMAQLYRKLGWKVDYVICIPSHRNTLKRRGYNQAEVLAKQLCKELHLPFMPNALIKEKDLPSQTTLSFAQRRANILHGFVAGKNSQKLQNKTVLLIDDVYTTGSTLTQACLALNKTASKIYCLTACRTTLKKSRENIEHELV